MNTLSKIFQYVKNTRVDNYSTDLMKWIAQFTSDTDDFVSVHGIAWLILGVIGVPYISYLAGCADYEVLYGTFMMSSQNHAYAHNQALSIAILIQIAIAFTAGKVIFTLTNKLHQKKGGENPHYKGHRKMLIVYSVIFLCGFSATIYLSFQTDQKEKQKGQQVFNDMKQNKASEEEIYFNKQSEEESKITKQYTQDSLNAYKSFYAEKKLLTSARYEQKISDYKGKLKKWKGRLNHPKFMREGVQREIAECERQIAKYKAKIEKQTKPAYEGLTEALKIANNIKQQKLNKIFYKYDRKTNSVDTFFKAGITDLSYSVALAAKATKGKNVALNFISVVLVCGLVFFKKEATKDTKPQKDTKTKATNHTGHKEKPKPQSKQKDTEATKDTKPQSRPQKESLYKTHRVLINRTRTQFSRSCDPNENDTVRATNSLKANQGMEELREYGLIVSANPMTGKVKIEQP